MVTRSFANEDGSKVYYSVDAATHCLDPDNDVDGVEGAVVATQNRAGHWNCEFQGPDSLNTNQRETCIEAVMAKISEEEAAVEVETARRIEAMRLAAETPATPTSSRPSRSAAAVAARAAEAQENATAGEGNGSAT